MELAPQKPNEEKIGFLNFPEVKKVVELKSLNYKPTRTMYRLLYLFIKKL